MCARFGFAAGRVGGAKCEMRNASWMAMSGKICAFEPARAEDMAGPAEIFLQSMKLAAKFAAELFFGKNFAIFFNNRGRIFLQLPVNFFRFI